MLNLSFLLNVASFQYIVFDTEHIFKKVIKMGTCSTTLFDVVCQSVSCHTLSKKSKDVASHSINSK